MGTVALTAAWAVEVWRIVHQASLDGIPATGSGPLVQPPSCKIAKMRVLFCARRNMAGRAQKKARYESGLIYFLGGE
jgi:hypothetical protein